MTSWEKRRLNLENKNCQFVEPSVYIDRLTSRHRLWRADDPVANVFGLLDPETGLKILVQGEKLNKYRIRYG